MLRVLLPLVAVPDLIYISLLLHLTCTVPVIPVLSSTSSRIYIDANMLWSAALLLVVCASLGPVLLMSFFVLRKHQLYIPFSWLSRSPLHEISKELSSSADASSL